jgi:putative SOS response-associated peptidase YedK
MCGRFPQSKAIDKYNKRMGYRIHIANAEAVAPTFNLAPSRLLWTIRAHEEELEAVPFKWGFGAGTPPPINARVETAATKFTFRDAWQHHRLLVPADGWYERKGEAGNKQPYYFVHRNGEPVFFAGLWTGETFCMFTTAADGELTAVHHRKPLALTPDQGVAWIKSGMTTGGLIEAAEKAETLTLHPVSKAVNADSS